MVRAHIHANCGLCVPGGRCIFRVCVVFWPFVSFIDNAFGFSADYYFNRHSGLAPLSIQILTRSNYESVNPVAIRHPAKNKVKHILWKQVCRQVKPRLPALRTLVSFLGKTNPCETSFYIRSVDVSIIRGKLFKNVFLETVYVERKWGKKDILKTSLQVMTSNGYLHANAGNNSVSDNITKFSARCTYCMIHWHSLWDFIHVSLL